MIYFNLLLEKLFKPITINSEVHKSTDVFEKPKVKVFKMKNNVDETEFLNLQDFIFDCKTQTNEYIQFSYVPTEKDFGYRKRKRSKEGMLNFIFQIHLFLNKFSSNEF